ncbi:MAG TPA: biotin transporter BioY [Rhabdochlamydiaceae bacterium]|jgi:biotin transport system substrate-specific component|nr:biotin transporter BioY [Rhabdochlamydiaceae bacterium]
MLRQAVLPFFEMTQDRSWLRNLLLVVGGSLLIALFARIAIPLPFSPIPIALQGHVCLLLGALLGKRMGALAVLVYLVQGAVGLPVFAFGHSGLPVLLGPRGGYLMGYLLGAWVTGYLVERSGSKNLRQAMLAMVIGNLLIYLCGLSQLSLFVGIKRVFLLGMLPFLIGDCFKLGVAYRMLKALKFKN